MAKEGVEDINMESVNEKLRKEYEKRKTYNPNIQKMVDEGRSRGSYMLPSMLNYKGLSNAEVKAKRKSIPKPIDTASGMIDWSKSYKGNFDLLGRTADAPLATEGVGVWVIGSTFVVS